METIMKRISRINTTVALVCLAFGVAVPANAQDEADETTSSIRYFEPVVDVSSSASSSSARSAASSARFGLSFRTLGRSFDVELEPNDLFVEGAKTTWIDDSGIVEAEPQRIFYRGRLRGDNESWARLTLRDDTMEGMVWTPDETYFFEPAAGLLGETAEGTVAYRLSDTESEWTEESCGVEGSSLRHHRHARRGRTSRTTLDAFQSLRSALQSTAPATALKRLQLGIVGDWELFQRHGGASDTHLQTIVNLLDGVYQREINVKIEITNTIIYSTSDDPFSDTTSPSSRLNEFGAYKNANDNSPGQLLWGADLAHLFTGVDLNGSTVGIAWVGTVCETMTGAGISQDYSSNMNSLVSLTAHEIGHNMAARHDSDVGCSSGFIMWPSVLTVSNLENLHFSTCSKSAIEQEVAAATCMDDFDSGTPTPTPTPTPTRTRTSTPTNTPPPPNAVAFVSQSVPTSMQAGQQYSASITLRNVGTKTWTVGNYALGSKNPHANTNFGTARLDLPSTVGPGQQTTFSWSFTAPSTEGVYNFQWQMLNVGVEWFGALTPNVTVSVQGSTLSPNALAFVSQSVPAQMVAGSVYEASVTLRNTGSNTWTYGEYKLASKNPHANTFWGRSRVDLGPGESIGTGQEKTFSWSFTAPNSPGDYNFQWQMLHVGIEWFGDFTPNVVVTVQAGSGLPTNGADFVSQSVATVMQSGQVYQAALTLQNTGANTWTFGDYVLGSMNPHGNQDFGPKRIDLNPDDSIATGQTKTFQWSFTAPAPGTYNFQWQMLHVGVEWFMLTPNVVVTVQ